MPPTPTYRPNVLALAANAQNPHFAFLEATSVLMHLPANSPVLHLVIEAISIQVTRNITADFASKVHGKPPMRSTELIT